MIKIFATLVTLLAVQTAHAGFWFDADLGYAGGSQLKYTKAATNYTFNSTAIPVGATIGWMFGNGIYVGADLKYSASGTFAASAGTTANDTYTRTRYGLGGGWMLGNWVIDGAYYLANTATITKATANTNSPDALQGTGYMLGFGRRFGARLNVGLNYNVHTYTTGDVGATKAATLSTLGYTTVTDSDVALTFTFPFTGGK